MIPPRATSTARIRRQRDRSMAPDLSDLLDQERSKWSKRWAPETWGKVRKAAQPGRTRFPLLVENRDQLSTMTHNRCSAVTVHPQRGRATPCRSNSAVDTSSSSEVLRNFD